MLISLMIGWPLRPAGQSTRRITEELQNESTHLRMLLEDSRYPAHWVRYNLALSLMAQDSLTEAAGLLLTALPRLKKPYKAEALNLMGVIDTRSRNYASALEYFKQAIKEQPENESYKRNFELATRLLAQQTPPVSPPPPTPQDKPQNDPRFGSTKPTEHLGKQWTYQPIEADHAEALLQLMRQREEQYIQQLRKTVRKQRQFSSRPQW